MDIAGRVILITGAARRVGRVIALELARRGAHIAFSWHFEDEPHAQTRAELEALGIETFVQRCDVGDLGQLHALVDGAVAHFGKLDVLINNASVWLNKPALQISPSEWDLALNVNARAPFFAGQYAARHMLAQPEGGVILNIADLSAFQVWKDNAHHAASKAALVSVTKSLALELAPKIRVNAIAPGTVLLPDGLDAEALAKKRSWAEANSALKRIGSPQDVAHLAAFLIEADFTTGAVYFVDGGRSLI
ncbi:MAG: SDR family oxidoreductase [Aggregatilineales bacterium]